MVQLVSVLSALECVLGCGVTLSGGAGTFTQSGTSTNTVGTLTISANQGGTGSSGAYELQGGVLNATTINVNQGGAFNHPVDRRWSPEIHPTRDPL
jgi:hypothetical protein